jgi:MoaA/NifB/PqqE/SkfB family radical SAM enzyme
MESVELLQIEPTTRCNYTCGFCAGRFMAQDDLAYERFAAALDAWPGLRHIELQGEGEPLLHRRFFDMMALARSRGIKVSFITNGSLLSDAAIDRILELAPEKLFVSMESADADLFQQIRGGVLSKVIRGLEALMARRRERGLERPAVGLAVTVLKQTIDELPAIKELYDRLGLDGGLSVQPLQTMDAYERHYSDAMRAQALSVEEKMQLMSRTRAGVVTPSAVVGFFDALLAGFEPGKRRCPWLDRGLYVNFQGAVTACCTIKDADKHGFGRLGETPSDEILARRAAMRDELAAGRMPEPCRGCTIAQYALLERR